jgi:hypothetical protein
MTRFAPLFFTIFLATLPLDPGRASPPSDADTTTDSSTSFALIPPAVADQIRNEAATPAAVNLLKEADEDLAIPPDPQKVVRTQGSLPHEGIRDESELAEKDWPRMLILAMAYRLTGDPRYLQASERVISAWVDVYEVDFDPIDETNLDKMILAYDLTRSGLSQPTQKKMTKFLRTMAEGYLHDMEKEKKKKVDTDINNWESHRIKLATLAAYALGDDDLIAKARHDFHKQISVNIKRDGSVEDFYTRDAIHYVVYDLEPLITAALAAKAHGEDWFDVPAPGGASVEQAVDWLTPFALGKKTHEEFVHSRVAFDAARAKAGVEGFQGQWEPWHSIHLYQFAVLMDPKYAPTLQQIIASTGHAPDDALTLLAQVGL